jgi:NADH-quinone oxidoreductase subunit G
VLRVLGTLLGRAGVQFDTVEEVRNACLANRDVVSLLSNRVEPVPAAPAPAATGLQRIAEVPAYWADPLVRRASALQRTRDARAPRAWMNAGLMKRLGVAEGQPVRVTQAGGEARLPAALDDRLPDECVRIAAAHAATAALGPMFGAVQVEGVKAERAA